MKKFMEEHILLLFMVFVGTLTYMVGLRDKEAMKQEIDNNIIYSLWNLLHDSSTSNILA